jgi:poly(3-hydroxybutyrate) depolymerase
MKKYACALALTALLHAHSAPSQAPRINPEAQATAIDGQLAAMAALLEQHPDVAGLGQMAGLLASISRVKDSVKQAAAALVVEAIPLQKSGNSGEARRRLSHAVALLLNRDWTDTQEFAASLVLRADLCVTDPALPFLLQLSQSYPARYQPAGSMQIRLSITAAAPRVAIDVVIPSGGAARPLATMAVPSRDLIDEPLRLAVSLASVPAGSWLLMAELMDGETVVARVASPLALVQNLQWRRRLIEQGLLQIKGFDSVKATIRYPFGLADGLNARKREVASFDFPAQVLRSEQLMADLKRGRDSLTHAKGDSRRNYWFATAGEIMPYRLYVPVSWDGKRHLPLIVALHGGNLDENNMLDRGDGIVGKLAEQYGFIVAAPLGYRVNGGYGVGLSETDVLNVMELVAAEYQVDRNRIYLMGNSMGAGGTWTLASKYGEKFAGLAPCASSMNITTLSFEKFRNMPVLACVGSLDTQARKDTAQFGVAQVKKLSGTAEYLEVQGGTHGTGIQLAMPQIFEFFANHQKSAAGSASLTP